MDNILDIIFKASKNVKNKRKTPSVMLAVTEEVGELAKEVRVKYSNDCYKKGDVDGILGESCDILLSTVDILCLEGYTKEDIVNKIRLKISKWENLTKGVR